MHKYIASYDDGTAVEIEAENIRDATVLAYQYKKQDVWRIMKVAS